MREVASMKRNMPDELSSLLRRPFLVKTSASDEEFTLEAVECLALLDPSTSVEAHGEFHLERQLINSD